jgi:hypothetical protein
VSTNTNTVESEAFDQPIPSAREQLRAALEARTASAVRWATHHHLTHWHLAGWGCRPGCTDLATTLGVTQDIRPRPRGHSFLISQPPEGSRRRGVSARGTPHRLAAEIKD